MQDKKEYIYSYYVLRVKNTSKEWKCLQEMDSEITSFEFLDL